MLNVELLKEFINEKYKDRKTFSERMIMLGLDMNTSHVSIYRILRERTCNLENLIKLKKILGFSYDEMIID